MNNKKLTNEEIHAMSYDDVAFMILTENNKSVKVFDLFKKIAKLYDLSESMFEEQIADFFELISTDKRFVILENGTVDLKSNHVVEVAISDIEEIEEIVEENEDEDDIEDEVEAESDEDLFYKADDSDNDDVDDGLDGLVIIDEENVE